MKLIQIKFRWAVPLLFLAVFSGCATTVKYNADYLEWDIKNIEPTIQGKALIVTESKEDNRSYSQGPSSFIGATLKVQGNFSQYLYKISESVFDRFFTEGSDQSYKLKTRSDYKVIIKPEIVHFDYRFNRLKNLFVAVTSESSLSLYVEVFNRKGTKVFEKKYESSYVPGDTYLLSLKPAEKINKSIHKALFKLVMEVSEDVAGLQTL